MSDAAAVPRIGVPAPRLRALLVQPDRLDPVVPHAGGGGRLAALRADRQRLRPRPARPRAVRPDAGAYGVRRPRRRSLRPPHHPDAVPDHRGLRRRDPGLRHGDRIARHPDHLRRRRSGRLGPRLRNPDHGGDHPDARAARRGAAAMAWFASANQTGQIVGPALGGVLYLLGPTDGLWRHHRAVGGRRLHAGADALRARAALNRAVQPALVARRLPLRAARPHHPRHIVARHVRGVPRRRDRAAADLCARHPADRAVGTGPSSLGAGGWRAGHVDRSGAPAADLAGRPRAVQRADHLRARGDLLCLLTVLWLSMAALAAWARPTWSAS